MLAYAKDTSHEKIIRGLALGIAFMHYRLENEADGIIEQVRRVEGGERGVRGSECGRKPANE